MPSSDKRSSSVRRALAVAAFLGTVAVVALGVQRIVERRRAAAEIQRMRGRAVTMRAAADSCLTELSREEADLRDFRDRIDQLREDVRAFETAEEGGVEAERYDEYIELFDRYNAAVPEWEARADTLRMNEMSCRAIIREQNAVADSFRRLVEPPPEGS